MGIKLKRTSKDPEPTIPGWELVSWIVGSMTLGLVVFSVVLLKGGPPPETAKEALEGLAPWLVFALAALVSLNVLLSATAKSATTDMEVKQAKLYTTGATLMTPRQKVAAAGVTLGYSFGSLAYVASFEFALVAVVALFVALGTRLAIWLVSAPVGGPKLGWRLFMSFGYMLCVVALIAWLPRWLQSLPEGWNETKDDAPSYSCTVVASQALTDEEMTYTCTGVDANQKLGQ